MATQTLFPRGRIALGAGDLVDCTNFKLTLTNNAKQVHTLRQKGAGYTVGTEETTVSFDAVIGTTGEEAAWLSKVQSGEVVQVRAKFPGGLTVVVDGVVKSADYDAPLDDAVKVSVEIIGKAEVTG
jgi:spore germination protein YaaH